MDEQRFELVASATCWPRRTGSRRAKFRRWISTAVARELLDGLADGAPDHRDPPLRPHLARSNDDYLIALAARPARTISSPVTRPARAPDPQPPFLSPRQFVDLLDA